MREAWYHSEEGRHHRICEDARGMSLNDKIGLIDDLYRIRRTMHAMYVQCFFPDMTDQQIVDHWARMTFDPDLYVAVRQHRIADGYDVLPLPMPVDMRLDRLIRRLLDMEARQVFCEQYHEPVPANSSV